MKRRVHGIARQRSVGLFVLLLTCSVACRAWTSQHSANIIGQIADEGGALLPGVAVAPTSPALQSGSLTATSDERGEYRLTPRLIGTYHVTYSRCHGQRD